MILNKLIILMTILSLFSSCGAILNGENLDADLLFSNSKTCNDEALYVMGHITNSNGGSGPFVPDGNVLKSTNGLDWEIISQTPEARTYTPVYFKEKFWLIGGGDSNVSPNQKVYSSADAITWTDHGSVFPGTAVPRPVVFNGKIRAIGGILGSNQVLSSADGVTWTQDGTLSFSYGFDMPILHGGSMFLVGGLQNGVGTKEIYESTDGISFTIRTEELPTTNGVRTLGYVKYQGAHWIIGGYDDVTSNPFYNILKSTDAVNWVDQVVAATVFPIFSALIEFNGSIFMIGGTQTDTRNVYKISNPLTWAYSTSSDGQLPVNADFGLTAIRHSPECKTGTNGWY